MRRLVVCFIVFGVLPALAAAEPPVATVGKRSISRAELEAHVRAKLLEIENQRYDALREGIDDLIAEELFTQEAKARGMTAEALVQQEVAAKVGEPTEAEIQKVYDDNKEQLQGQTLEAVKPRILQFLQQQKQAQRSEAFLAELKAKYQTNVNLRPPVVNVSTGGRAARGGGEKAPVTIIAFSDYECPFCKKAEGALAQVMSTYKDKVRFIHRDFPLPFHQHARPAADASLCANAQGKFWEYHDKLFANQDLSTEKLQAFATELGLDRAKFDECVTKQPFKAVIDKDVKDGSEVGVNGTPAFFINGRMLSGAQPFEKFKEVIDDELAHAKSPKS